MRVGILGLGVMGGNHLRVLRDLIGVDEVVAFDMSPQFSNRKLPGVFKCDSYDEFLEKQNELDYSVISTPTTLHEEHLTTFLKEGWNVLVEKPLVANLNQGQNIMKIAGLSNSKVTVGHIERFNPAIVETKRKIQEGFLGNIFQIETVRQGPLPIRISDVGVVADLASHDIDLIHYLTLDSYSYVFADLKFFSGRKSEDSMVVMGRTRNDVSILHNVNWISPKKERYVTIMGDNGTLHVDCLRSQLFFYENASVLIEDERIVNFRGVSEGNAISYAFPKVEALYTQHLQFMKSIKGESAQTIPLAEAMGTLVVMDAISKSHNCREKVLVEYV